MGTQLRLEDANVAEWLRSRGLLAAGEVGRAEPAGEGNINWVRRVRIEPIGRSVVVKQARPALERFPEYRVSTERIVFEHAYYEVVAPFDRSGVCPRVLHFDPGERVLVLEDLGQAERLDHALLRGAAPEGAAALLAAFLGRVHAGTRDAAGALAARFANGEMQRLHGDHIFQLPLRPNDFPLPGRVRVRAEALWQDTELVSIADAAYSRYLTSEGALVHADAQAGNVLLCADGPKLVDAEIAHIGDPAFDLGSLVAHLALPSIARGQAADARPLVEAAWQAYRAAEGGGVSYAEAARYAGLELLRRTIGAARVAAVADESASLRVLEAARRWIIAPAASPGGSL